MYPSPLPITAPHPATAPCAPTPSLPAFLSYDHPRRLLLCRTHGFYLTRDRLEPHFRVSHSRWDTTELVTRAEAIQYINTLELLEAVTDWQQVADPIAPIPELGVPFEGVECAYIPEQCTFRSKS